MDDFKEANARLLMTLNNSPDECISKAGIELRTGRKWPVSQAVDVAKKRLAHQDDVQHRTTRMGTKTRDIWSSADDRTRLAFVQQEIRK